MALLTTEDVRKDVETLFSSSRNVINVRREILSAKDSIIPPSDENEDEPESFFDELMDMHHEDRPGCLWTARRDLLRRYVEKKNANLLVFNIYGHQKEFNVEIEQGTTTHYQSELICYDDKTLMDFLDREEIPPIVVTALILKRDLELFVEGGVIAELRFFGPSSTSSTMPVLSNQTGSFYLYLKLSDESKLALIDLYGMDSGKTLEEVRNAEAKLIMSTSGPLCLDPSPEVSIVSNHLKYEKKLFANPQLKRVAQRNLPEVKEKRRSFDCVPITPLSEAMKAMMQNNFFSDEPMDATKEEVEQKSTGNLYAAANFDLRSMNKKICRFPPLKRPSQSEEERFYNKYFHEMMDNEHHKSLQSAVITITRNTADKLFRGTLTLSCDSEISQSISRTFLLGTQDSVDRFTEQFTEVFTEAGCKPVVMQQNGPGAETKTEYTPCVRDRAQEEDAKIEAVEPTPSTSFMVENILSGSTQFFSHSKDLTISKLS